MFVVLGLLSTLQKSEETAPPESRFQPFGGLAVFQSINCPQFVRNCPQWLQQFPTSCVFFFSPDDHDSPSKAFYAEVAPFLHISTDEAALKRAHVTPTGDIICVHT